MSYHYYEYPCDQDGYVMKHSQYNCQGKAPLRRQPTRQRSKSTKPRQFDYVHNTLPPSMPSRDYNTYFEDDEPLLYYWPAPDAMSDDYRLDNYYINATPAPIRSSQRQGPPVRRRSLTTPTAWRDYDDYERQEIDRLIDPPLALRRRNTLTSEHRYVDPVTSPTFPWQSDYGAPPYAYPSSGRLYSRPPYAVKHFEKEYEISDDDDDRHEYHDNINVDYCGSDSGFGRSGDENCYCYDDDCNDNARDIYVKGESTHQRMSYGNRRPQRQDLSQHPHMNYDYDYLPWMKSQIMGSSISSPSRQHRQSQPVLHSHYSHMKQGPVPSRDAQPHSTSSFYQVAPNPQPPPILPMPQPMIHAPSLLSPSFPQQPAPFLFPTMQFNPMMMPQPTLPPALDINQSAVSQANIQQIQQRQPPVPTTATTTTATMATTATTAAQQSSSSSMSPSAPILSDNGKSPQSAPDLNANASATTASPENALVPLVRSLSLSSSQPLRTPRRRRSLFGNLFNLNGGGLSRHNSVSSTPNEKSATSAVSSPSLLPVNGLTVQSLSRKQSLSLEKTAKALSKRSFIWCYREKLPLVKQQVANNLETTCWTAMTPKNQIKLDPYLCYYQPNSVVKEFVRTEQLLSIVYLDKEPKLSGSITAVPKVKFARVYHSLLSSSNYTDLYIDCLPADSQFVVRSN